MPKKPTIPINTRFGELIVIKEIAPTITINKESKKVYTRREYLCKCDCGTEIKAVSSRLTSGKKTACNKCAWKKRPIEANRRSDVEAFFLIVSKGAVSSRKERLKWFLNLEEFTPIVNLNCVYCGNKPSKRWLSRTRYANFNGIDRVDSSKHYTIDNCVPCCRQCNIMKWNFTEMEFKEHVLKITNFLKLKG